MQSIIPNKPNTSPDYYCTWQTQLYCSNDGGPIAQRRIINEENLFGTDKYQGWAYLHPLARRDLHIVLDDSWDVPLDGNEAYYGSLVLNKEKFPSFVVDDPTESLRRLSDKLREIGWRSLGGWVCLQESPLFIGNMSCEEYWEQRIKRAVDAGMGYLKIDWGNKAGSLEARKLLTELSHKHARGKLCVEQAILKECVPISDSFRTYDVPAIMSIPMTFHKLSEFLDFTAVEGYDAIVNCEDEVYIASVLGLGMGVMRHSFTGVLPDGRPDPSFPEIHRCLKSKMYEVVRAVRWHRVAPAFAVDASQTHFSKQTLTDTWEVRNQPEEIEAWWKYKDGDIIEKEAPASISRGCENPVVSSENGILPYCAASINPNGVFSIGVFGRTLGRQYILPECEVLAKSGCATTFGIFGHYKRLTIECVHSLENARFIAQDMAGDSPEDITGSVKIDGNRFTLDGALIDSLGTVCNPKGDTSEAGLALKIVL